MSPAFFVILKRLLCAGLCCIALSTQANTTADTASDHHASTAQTQHNSSAAQAQQPHVVSTDEANAQTAASSVATPLTTPQVLPPSTTTPGVTAPSTINAKPIGGGQQLVSVTLALLGIIALIFAISWFVKRFGHGGFTQNQHIKIMSTMPLGTRERIVLIDAGGQQLLLGITATAINTLHVFSEPVVLPEKDERSSDFSRKLMAILQQKSSGATSEHNNNNDDPAAR